MFIVHLLSGVSHYAKHCMRFFYLPSVLEAYRNWERVRGPAVGERAQTDAFHLPSKFVACSRCDEFTYNDLHNFNMAHNFPNVKMYLWELTQNFKIPVCTQWRKSVYLF